MDTKEKIQTYKGYYIYVSSSTKKDIGLYKTDVTGYMLIT